MLAHRRLLFITPALAALVSTPVAAADTPATTVEQLQQQVSALAAQVDKLQGEKSSTADVDSIRGDIQVFKDSYARDKERNLVQNQNGRYVQVTGTLQTRVTGTTLQDSRGTRQLGIDLPLAQIGLRGILYRDYSGGRNLEAVVNLQTIRGAASYVNVNQTVESGGEWAADNNGNNTPIALGDTNLKYNFLPTNDAESGRFAITLGQFTPKFGLEGSAPENLKPSVRGSLVTTLSVPRQLGIELSGDFLPTADYGYDYRAPLFAYWLAVTNGAASYSSYSYGRTVRADRSGLNAATSSAVLASAGSGANLNDNNNQKAVTARIEFIPPHDYNSWLRQVKIGASAAFDKSNAVSSAQPAKFTGALTADQIAANRIIDENPANALIAYDLHRRVGFDISYTHSPFTATYEFVASADNTTTNRVYDKALTLAQNNARGYGTDTSKLEGFGHALTLGYIFGEQFLSNNVRDGGKWDDSWPQSFQPYVRYDTWNPNRDENHEVRNISVGANLFFAQTTKFQVQASQIYSEITDQRNRELLAQFQYVF